MPNCKNCPYPKSHAIHGPYYTSSSSSVYSKHEFIERPKSDIVLAALEAALTLHSKNHALDRFDWGKSFLRAEDIRELNELPGQLARAINEYKAR